MWVGRPHGLHRRLLRRGVLDLFTWGGSDKKLKQLVEHGELVPATVDGIKHVDSSDNPAEWYWGLDVHTSSGPYRTTVKQTVTHKPELLTLGRTVKVRHLKGRTAIDWAETLRGDGIACDEPVLATKLKCKPIEPGIDDSNVSRRKLERGQSASAVLVDERPVVVFGMTSQNSTLALDVRTADGQTRRVTVKNALIPPYVRTRVVEGALIPVAVDPKRADRVTIDWETFGAQSPTAPPR